MENRGERFEGPATQARPTAGARGGLPLRATRHKLGLATLAIERARRGTAARLRRSRLVRWRHRAPLSDDLALSPPNLRPLDPSFADELDSGSVGFGGQTVQLRGASVFEVVPPSETWARELHGFSWLRHLDATRTLNSEVMARELVAEWIARSRKWPAFAWAPEVVGRRMLSWLSHAGLVLDGAERRPYAAFMLSLEDQATYLSASWRNAPDGYPRLLALIGLMQASLCIAGHDSRQGQAERHLVEELQRQVLTDGGHLSRNPAVLIDLLFELLPLRQCFLARGLTPDSTLATAIDRMMGMLRRLRLGDGQLARFNGMGATERGALSTVLTYDKGEAEPGAVTSASGYVRLHCGSTVVLVDAGAPPPIELAGEACGSCLAFEFSAGDELLFANGGAPGPAHERYRAASRGSASHNTLVLGGRSSTKLARGESQHGIAPMQSIGRVRCETQEAAEGMAVAASHDGYADRFGLVHTRALALDASGDRLDGRDALSGVKAELRFAWDVPFAIHFHLHPRAGARLAGDGGAELILPSGARWRLSAAGATLTIEESTHFADLMGPLQAQQIVLRGVCYGAAEVNWTLERIRSREPDGILAQLAEARALLAESPEPDGEIQGDAPSIEAATDDAEPQPLAPDKPD